ncbi:MAG: molybdenum cofactor biosynthesis protein B [Gammaproteobacteria bacterium]|nr:MAG: molybdenum cofactor biosynthesis protein B [Gammaproteobacteria bacterium]
MATKRNFISLNIAILTVSDSRTEETDTSGAKLQQLLEADGHQLAAKQIVPDDRYQIRAIVSRWIADDDVSVVITTGGTGLTGRDGTPEAVLPLVDKVIDGFGEMFRMLSYEKIKTSTLQSRAMAGVANGTFIFCLPGSTGACIDGWSMLISEQLDHRTFPCNLVELIPRLGEE